MRTSRLSLAGVLAAGWLAAGCTTTPDRSQPHLAGELPSLLYVQVAESGSLEPDPARTGFFELRLDAPMQRVIYFSDRPQRVTGSIAMQSFLDSWAAGENDFVEDPPNAALALDETESIAVFELTDPRVDDAGLRYTARLLPESDSFGMRHRSGQQVQPGVLPGLTLFIDGGDFAPDPLNQPDPAYGGTTHRWQLRPLWTNP